ncbi:MAG: hypothetical protein ACT4NP_16965 [Pseudonocardiales bacterium]
MATAGGELSGIVGVGESTIQAQVDAARRFGLPLLTGTAVVQRDPDGLDPQAAQRAVLRALEVDQRTLDTGLQPGRDLYLPLPLINSPMPVPAAREQNTTVVTYLFADPTLGLNAQVRVARDYAVQFDRPDDALVGVTGMIPSQAQARRVLDRSVVAPLDTLVTAAIGYLLALAMSGTRPAADRCPRRSPSPCRAPPERSTPQG